MNKFELISCLARRSRQSKAAIADRLDALVYRLWKERPLWNRPVPERATAPKDASAAPEKK